MRASPPRLFPRARRADALRARTGLNARGRLGTAGEAAAAAFLTSLGYRILRRNLRGPGGEIDIVARDGETLVFIEVKTRRGRTFGSALSAVDARKRKRLRAAAEDFLQFFDPGAKARFDVLAIEREKITLHRDAF